VLRVRREEKAGVSGGAGADPNGEWVLGQAYWEGSTGQGTRRPAPEADSGRWFPQYLRSRSRNRRG